MTFRRGGGRRLMEKTILNFHVDYLTLSHMHIKFTLEEIEQLKLFQNL